MGLGQCNGKTPGRPTQHSANDMVASWPRRAAGEVVGLDSAAGDRSAREQGHSPCPLLCAVSRPVS
jgi:hypothetical protein